MHNRTVATLGELGDLAWFSNVGKHDSARANFVDTWQQAIQCCAGEKWRVLCEEAANQYRTRVAERDMGRFREWNALVREIKTTTIPLVSKKTIEIVKNNNLPEIFVHAVQWDVLHVCMEAEYADVFPPGFFAAQAYWYLQGHFPCGWEGDFPHGRPTVF